MADPPDTRPVHDWASDYDIFDPDYVRDPAPVWEDLRNRCPIARTQRWGGSWMPTRYEDMRKLAKMVPALSSRSPVVVPPSPELREVLVAEAKMYGSEIPPITSDPPEHKPYRRLILPILLPARGAERSPHESSATGLSPVSSPRAGRTPPSTTRSRSPRGSSRMFWASTPRAPTISSPGCAG